MGQRPGATDSQILIAAGAVLMFTAERFARGDAVPRPVSQPAAGAQAAGTAVIPGLLPGVLKPVVASPLRLSISAWGQILWRTVQRTSKDRLLANAAGVVFFGLLAVFPAITALVSCYGLFADPHTIGDNLQTLALMLPGGSFDIVQDQIARVLAKGNAELGVTFLFGLLLALWSANSGVKAVIDALNVAYEEEEERGFIHLNVLSLAFTLSGIAALLVMVAAVVAFPLALDHVGLAPDSQLIVSLARWPFLFVVLLVALGLLYRLGPSRPATPWRWLSVGAVVAALLWIAGSALLSFYLSNFANYSATYGSLGAAIGLMTWMWMSAITVLLGAELNSEIERQAQPAATTAGR
jgi:membrane protein